MRTSATYAVSVYVVEVLLDFRAYVNLWCLSESYERRILEVLEYATSNDDKNLLREMSILACELTRYVVDLAALVETVSQTAEKLFFSP